jgi:hypothetical protein
MREHRHAARRGSQSAYKAGQRRLPTQRGSKGSDAVPTNEQSTPRSGLYKRTQTYDVARGEERTNHRQTTGAISFSCPVGDDERHDVRSGHSN